jgi:hypothetical protein
LNGIAQIGLDFARGNLLSIYSMQMDAEKQDQKKNPNFHPTSFSKISFNYFPKSVFLCANLRPIK